MIDFRVLARFSGFHLSLVVVAVLALAPFFTQFTGMIQNAADPFSSLLLGLFIPFLLIALVYSIGVSAKRGG